MLDKILFMYIAPYIYFLDLPISLPIVVAINANATLPTNVLAGEVKRVTVAVARSNPFITKTLVTRI
jgi:hypothetical protein